MAAQWDSNLLKRLRSLCNKGLSASEIGNRLGFTKSAVIGKLIRMGWTNEMPGQPKPKTSVLPRVRKPKTVEPAEQLEMPEVIEEPPVEEPIISNDMYVPEELVETEPEEQPVAVRINAPYEAQHTNIEDMSPFERQVYNFYCLYKERGYVTENEIIDSTESFSDVSRLTERLLDLGVIIQEAPVKAQGEEYDASKVDYDIIYKWIVEEFPDLKKFIKKVKKIKAPQRNEWQQLIPQVKSGNRWAYERMFEMYLRIVLRTAWYYYRKFDMSFYDAVQDGCAGLLYAIETFDHTELKSFPAYVTRPIVGYITRFGDLPQHTMFCIPAHVKDNIFKIYDLVQNHQCQECMCGKKVDCETLKDEIVAKLNCTLEAATEYLNLCTEYENNIYDLADEDTESPFEKFSKRELGIIVRQLLAELDPKEAMVLQLRYGLESDRIKTLEEVGEYLGVTRERVRQIEQKALNKLKHPTRARTLRSFLGDYSQPSRTTSTVNLSKIVPAIEQTPVEEPAKPQKELSKINTEWTYEDIQRLKKFAKMGMPPGEMKDRFDGKTRGLVIQKLKELGLR